MATKLEVVPDELAAARFDRATHSDQLRPADVLHGALSDTDVMSADHVMVIYYMVDDDGHYANGWLQGGKLTSIGQLGLLTRTMTRLQEDN